MKNFFSQNFSVINFTLIYTEMTDLQNLFLLGKLNIFKRLCNEKNVQQRVSILDKFNHHHNYVFYICT